MLSPIKSPRRRNSNGIFVVRRGCNPLRPAAWRTGSIIDKAAAHCATNKIEESALRQDRLYPDMFCLARQIRQAADFAMNSGGRLAGFTPPAMPTVAAPRFAAAKL